MTSAELKFDLFLKSYHPSHRFVYKANPGNAGDGVIASATYDFFERNALTYVPYRADEHYSPDTDILIFDEPTRGIDVGAKLEIYELMNRLVAKGKSIIMISSELPEVLGMCDRILVMRSGRIAGEIAAEHATQEKIMQYATLED